MSPVWAACAHELDAYSAEPMGKGLAIVLSGCLVLVFGVVHDCTHAKSSVVHEGREASNITSLD